jgi:hypothetical protein
VISFSRKYFEELLKKQGYDFSKGGEEVHTQEEVLNHGPEVKIEKVYKITQQGTQWSLNRFST